MLDASAISFKAGKVEYLNGRDPSVILMIQWQRSLNIERVKGS